MAILGDPLDVLGKEIATPYDQNIFQPADYYKVTIPQESQVAGAQERPFARIGEATPERLRCCGGSIPVAAGNAGTR